MDQTSDTIYDCLIYDVKSNRSDEIKTTLKLNTGIVMH